MTSWAEKTLKTFIKTLRKVSRDKKVHPAICKYLQEISYSKEGRIFLIDGVSSSGLPKAFGKATIASCIENDAICITGYELPKSATKKIEKAAKRLQKHKSIM